MSTNFRRARVALSLTAGTALAVASATAVPQDESEIAEGRIEAARADGYVGRASSGAPIRIVQLRRAVSYADLDLSTHEGANELERRINAVAKAACRHLETLNPVRASDGPGRRSKSCVREAVDSAMTQATAAVAAAERRIRSAELKRP